MRRGEIPPIKLYGGWRGGGWGLEGRGRGGLEPRRRGQGRVTTRTKRHAFSWCELPHAQACGGEGGAARGSPSEGPGPLFRWLQTGRRGYLPPRSVLFPARATPVLSPVHLALCSRAPAARGLPARPPWLSGCQFLDGPVVVLRDGGRQRVPAVGVQLDDLQEQGPGQHGLRGTQHLIPRAG